LNFYYRLVNSTNNSHSSPLSILVTGATGNVGRHVVSYLVALGHQVRALSRNPASVSFPQGVKNIQGDLSQPETLDQALEGVDAVFLLVRAPTTPVGPDLVSRIRKSTRRLVFLSSSVVRDDLSDQPNFIARVHSEIEHLIENAGFDWTFLRPGMFATNTVNWWGPQIRAGNVLRWPYPRAALAPIDPRDIAAVAAHSVINPRHIGAKYLLTGPQSLTQVKMLESIGLAIGRKLEFHEISPDVARQELVAYLPAGILDILLDFWPTAVDKPAPLTETVSEVTGSLPRTFREWTMDYASRFDANVPEAVGAQTVGAR
jgi:uncharacterized protein YbjT (DUF2867 family)